jgi:hypothetical protein
MAKMMTIVNVNSRVLTCKHSLVMCKHSLLLTSKHSLLYTRKHSLVLELLVCHAHREAMAPHVHCRHHAAVSAHNTTHHDRSKHIKAGITKNKMQTSAVC